MMVVARILVNMMVMAMIMVRMIVMVAVRMLVNHTNPYQPKPIPTYTNPYQPIQTYTNPFQPYHSLPTLMEDFKNKTIKHMEIPHTPNSTYGKNLFRNYSVYPWPSFYQERNQTMVRPG